MYRNDYRILLRLHKGPIPMSELSPPEEGEPTIRQSRNIASRNRLYRENLVTYTGKYAIPGEIPDYRYKTVCITPEGREAFASAKEERFFRWAAAIREWLSLIIALAALITSIVALFLSP